MSQRWLVSACLAGRACRYDGATRARPAVRAALAELTARGAVVTAVCPEERGGLGTPRPAAMLSGGAGAAVWEGRAAVRRVHDGAEVTEAFQRGAESAAAADPSASHALLKARSPSCGCGRAWQDGAVRPGDGVFAALLRARGLRLFTDEALPGPT